MNDRIKVTELEAIVKVGGRPIVILQDNLWDESFGEKGMIAVVTGVQRKSYDSFDDIQFVFDYSVAKEHNLSLQGHDWFLSSKGGETGKTGTAIEAGIISEDDFTEKVSFRADDDVPVTLRDEACPMAAYLISIESLDGEKPTYVEWLEKEWERQKWNV